jgi:energy-coupling factor transporter ATP-binding protein EcfA2
MTDIRLHVTSRGADRATLVGANGTGKSTLANHLIHAFKEDYPDARVLVHDTKPRWRAEYQADGTRASRRYRRMAEGDTITGSMALDRLDDWPLVWDRDVNPSQIVIAQRIGNARHPARHRTNILFQIMCAERFFDTQDAKRPSLIYFDEGMDFFHASAAARGGSDIVQRCYRAGREMGLASLFGCQRPVGISTQTLTEMNYCALFALNYTKDVKRLWEMGWPHDALPPTRHEPNCADNCTAHDPDGTFRLWRGGSKAPKYRLAKEGQRAA